MVKEARPLIGILGGMGPAATADLYAKLIRCTPAATDQEHLRIVIWADPTVPDRSAALLDGGADPVPHLERGTRALLDAGAELIGVACNTAHAFLPEVERRTGARFVHMVQRTAEHVAGLRPAVRTVGLMATAGTVRAGLYQEAFAARGVHVALPDAEGQRAVTRAIAAAKAGDVGPAVRAELVGVVGRLATAGGEAVIAGCTELALVLEATGSGVTGAAEGYTAGAARNGAAKAVLPVPWVDPALILARALVAAVRGR